jgi:PAS domain S-box-containing protein
LRNAALTGVRFALLVLGLSLGHATHADTALDTWRGHVTDARILAENDVPRAYEQAQLLQAAIPGYATAADRARLLNLMARIELHAALTAKAIEHARAALKLATENNDRIGQAEAHLNLYRTSINEGNMAALIASATQGVAVLDGVDRPDLLGEAMVNMAMMYQRVGQFDESVAMTMQSMEIAKHSKNPTAMAFAAQGLSISFTLNGRPKEAYEHNLLMLENARAAHSKILEALALHSIGVALDNLGDPDKGEKYLTESVKLYRSIGAPFGISHTLDGLAGHYERLGHFDQALRLYNEAIDIWTKYDNPIGLWYPLRSRCQIYLRLGNYAAALADAELGENLAKRINNPLYLGGSAQQLAAVHAAKGNYQHAFRYMQEAAAMAEDMQRKKSSARLVELIKRYETESRQREINELTRRNEMQTAELRQRELQQRWLWTVLAASVALLALTAFFLMRLRRSHATIRGLNAGLEQTVQARTAELRQRTRYLRTLIDSLPWQVWLKDTDSRYLAANQAAADTCGIDAEHMVGRTDGEVWPRAVADAYRADDLEVMMLRQGKTMEEHQVVADQAVWMEIFKAPVLDEDGTVLGTVGFARDISERKAAEALREAALIEAQRLARVRSEFLAQMSHELRTPLNAILGYAQILLREPHFEAKEVARLSVIQQSGEHLLTLINDILDFAKIDAGKVELYETDIPVARFIRVIAEMVQVKTAQKGLAFHCNVAPDLPKWVHADEKRLRQVLLNLLSNAVKFTEKGSLEFDVRMTAEGRMRFEVRDTGMGIAQDKIASIFKPFEQAGDVQHRIGGTGLGLAISQQFVRLMGGEIRVESQAGAGSRFWFDLALAVIETADDTPQTPVPAGYTGRRRKILVIDDIAENRSLVVDMLDPFGFVMLEAADAQAGIALAQAERPDLIVIDLIMPGIDGLEATRRLRAIPGLRNVPVIAVSASAMGDDKERSLAAGANAFMPKPLDYGTLIAGIGALLELELAWDADAVRAGSVPSLPEPIVAPPADSLDELHRLARLGNMQEIMQWAERLHAGDSRYAPFARHLANLARTYRSRAVLEFVKRHMEGVVTS